MAITYHSGRRIQATNTDIASTPAVIGGWKELGRVTVGAGQTSVNLDVTSLTDKRYYMILHNHITDGTAMRIGIKFNGDDATPYSYYETRNQGSNPRTGDTNNAGGSELNVTNALNTAENWFGVAYLANKASENKLYLSHYAGQNATGANNAPERVELAGKWTKGTDAVNQITASRVSGGGVADSGSELIVLGYDPADTHTTNFWEELASVDVSTGTSINSGTFTAKKYLWVQTYIDLTASNYDYRFNSDGTSSYCNRLSNNGGNDVTQLSQSYLFPNHGFGVFPHFENMFIVNNASNEKLIISHTLGQGTAGAGTEPQRSERVGKWTNTSEQITDINVATTGNVNRLIMKVWGSN
tara:strand:- start:558 stop:1625 length:1068 start_codon:yes stop_codon:yes gene_type:complete